ncbi:MAG: MBL fold metallo-hydrolase [Actinomycetota bacterium]|nr:MBL fold metallo-hydrolase [Actinomycetota bacterium]
MEIFEVASGVHHVTASKVNWQLIVDGDAVTVVDAGWPWDYKRIVASLNRIGHTPASVDSVILTHAHVDHIGAAEKLRAKHDIPIRAQEEEEALAMGRILEGMTAGYLIPRLWKPSVFRFATAPISRGGSFSKPLGEVATFKEGIALDTAGRPVPVHVPGHTSGSTAYLLEDRGVLITGDALVTIDLWSNKVGARVMPAQFNHDHDQTIASLDRLRGLQASLIVSGHGPLYEGTPKQAVEEALALL